MLTSGPVSTQGAVPGTLRPGDVHVWLAWTGRCEQAGHLARYSELLDASEVERWRRFAFDYLKHEFLLTRALCRVTLSHYAPRHPGDWRFVRNAYGRPSLAPDDIYSRLRFNLSNSSGLVVCAVTLDEDVGIDIEYAGRHRCNMRIAERFFSPREVDALHACTPESRADLFMTFWTLKESYIKARGLGMSMSLDRFSFERHGPDWGVTFNIDVDDDASRWRFHASALEEDHHMAVAMGSSNGNEPRLSMQTVMPAIVDGAWSLQAG